MRKKLSCWRPPNIRGECPYELICLLPRVINQASRKQAINKAHRHKVSNALQRKKRKSFQVTFKHITIDRKLLGLSFKNSFTLVTATPRFPTALLDFTVSQLKASEGTVGRQLVVFRLLAARINQPLPTTAVNARRLRPRRHCGHRSTERVTSLFVSVLFVISVMAALSPFILSTPDLSVHVTGIQTAKKI